MRETYTLSDLALIRGCFLVELNEEDAGLRLTDRTAVTDQRFEFFVEKRIVQLMMVGGNRKQREAQAAAGYGDHQWQLTGATMMPSPYFTDQEILNHLNGKLVTSGEGTDRFHRRLTLPEMDRLFEYYKKRQFQ